KLGSNVVLRVFVAPIAGCSKHLLITAAFLLPASSWPASSPSLCSRGWDKTFFHRWIVASLRCTCEPQPECALKKQLLCVTAWKTKSASRSRDRKSTRLNSSHGS